MKFSQKLIDLERYRKEESIPISKISSVSDLYDAIKDIINVDPQCSVYLDCRDKMLVLDRLETDEEVIKRLEPEFKNYQKLKDKFEN
jgi:hypothetical protein